MRTVNLIAACSENRVIGNAGRIPWVLRGDNAFLKRQTLGQTVVCGRRVLAEWPSVTRGRDVVVVTRNAGALPEGARAAPDLRAALALAEREALRGGIYVCGGGRLYAEALPLADRLFLTLVKGVFPGDRFFPEWRGVFTREISRRRFRENGLEAEFLVLER
ncbi:MAG: dihydrofolate reductase [Opitutaceae bacterium]|jgi:dihydrofolate reductase|nr:dihydrofolate reductase [Opitutaceae bacterium]